jgi:AcrR family transcriptional regulator
MTRMTDSDDKALVVLKAASGVFLAHGFSAASTDMIQSAAGVSKATVYARYPNKEALFLAVIEWECAQFAQQTQAIQAVPGDIRQTLGSLGRAYLDVVLSPTALALFRVVVAEAPRFPQIGQVFYRSGPRVMTALVRQVLAQASPALALQDLGLENASQIFLGLLRNQAQLECLTHPQARPSEVQLDDWAALAVDTFLRAFTPPPRPA